MPIYVAIFLNQNTFFVSQMKQFIFLRSNSEFFIKIFFLTIKQFKFLNYEKI